MRRAALLVSLLLVLVGCSGLKSIDGLTQALEADGYGVGVINDSRLDGVTTLSVQVVRPNEVPTQEQADDVAEIVWTKYAEDFDELEVTINNELTRTTDADELAATLGGRPAGLTDGDGRSGVNIPALMVSAAIAAVIAGLVVLWRRSRRQPPTTGQPSVHTSAGED